MLVKKIYDASDMMEEFKMMGRDQFSYEGYEALLEMFEECYNEPVELDVIAICCEFTEAEPDEIARDYGYTFDGMTWNEAIKEVDADDLLEELLNEMNYHTWAVDLGNGSILYQNY